MHFAHLFVPLLPKMNKNLYIISGCNGAGKTTASYTVLPEILDCKEFVNADEIARGLSPFNPDGVAIEAGRLMLNHHLLKYVIMSNKEIKEFSEKLRNGLEIAEKRMLQEKALHGEDIIISPDGLTFQRIPAKQVIAENPVFQN